MTSYKDNNINNNIINRVNKNSRVISHGYFLLSEAEPKCAYSQEYLSLLARKGWLKAKKFGRNWYTTKEWLAEYIKEHDAEAKAKEASGAERMIKKSKSSYVVKKLKIAVAPYKDNNIKSADIKAKKEVNKKTGRIFLKSLIAEAVEKVKIFLTYFGNPLQAKSTRRQESDDLLRKQIAIQVAIAKLEKATRQDIIAGEDKEEVSNSAVALKDKSQQQPEKSFGYEGMEDQMIDSGAWLWGFLKNKLSEAWFVLVLSLVQTWRAPFLSVKHWSGLSFSYKFQTMTVSLAMLVFLSWIGLCQVNHRLVER